MLVAPPDADHPATRRKTDPSRLVSGSGSSALAGWETCLRVEERADEIKAREFGAE